jgi:putative Holliday junction resolvase
LGRILALDYGRKRTGIAVTDPLQMIANGLQTVSTHELISFLKQYLLKEKVDAFVIGMPKTLLNQASESQKYLKPFLGNLKKEFPEMKVYEIDERFTSSMALQTMIDGGMKKKDRQVKGTVDTISATIILQSYLEQKNNNVL